MNAITVRQIRKSFQQGKKAVQAVNPLNLDVARGELFGLIGPDGAGKTTLIRMLATLLLPDEGSAMVFGHDVVRDAEKIRLMTGYMPGRFSLYPDLSVEENLRFYATIFGVWPDENKSLIRDIYAQLESFRTRPAGKLSGGMKQKLALCCALVHRPEILLLDEPTTGVDAVSRVEFWNTLDRLRKEGITILVSTPYMDEANRCDRVALMQTGRMMQIDTPHVIISSYPEELFAVRHPHMYRLLQHLKQTPGVRLVYPFGTFHHVVMEKSDNAESQLRSGCQEFDNLEVSRVEADIEDCFILAMQS
jgi:ABC-type multidrug transport system ATPase subunit